MLADINGNLADLRSEAMASQRFCLRWNNHQSNLLSVFDQLLHDEAFVDVTLAVEGQLLRAHKMVLSACSPYFQALFTNHPDKHPIVILKDVPYVDMRSLLDFMYRGEVSVDQDRLPAFLRVAESLRIKGLTEVNEEKCDLPSITSSLLGNQNILSQHQQQQQQQHQQQQQQQQPPPNLHRINQIGSSHHHHGGGGGGGQKRYHHMSSHPLLGSALTAPKRKRGRPRKLSGSSDTGGGDGPQDLQTSDLVQGSPEMMEMKMGIDFQSETSTGNGNANNSGSNRSANSTPGPITGRKDDSMENGERDTPEPVTPKIKKELEPTPSTSAQESGSGSPAKSETSEKNKGRDSSVSRTSSPLTPSQTETAASRLTPTTTTTPSSSTTTTTTTTTNSTTVPSSSTATTTTTTTNNSSTTTATATTTTSSTTTTTTTASSNNKSASPAASGRGGNQVQQQTPTGEGAMSAPTGRQVPKRRMRRRATSQSQDPAEQLTEMSVRGLNLFRYASISEGVYQCTECAKLDIQKTFKNKYSFQRHAFLYHEGHQRKVFPCPVCAKEFSRPDKMKNHMKTVHDCFMPKDCVVPFGFYNL